MVKPNTEDAVIDKRKRKITYKQKQFVKEFIANGGNGTRAALRTFDTVDYSSAGAIASEYLKKPLVRDLLESYAAKSVSRIEQLADGAKSEYVQLEANKDILDRAGYKAIERVENISINVTLSGTLASKRQITNGESSVTP